MMWSADAQELIESFSDFEVLFAVFSLHDDGVVFAVQFDAFDFDAQSSEGALHFALHQSEKLLQSKTGDFAIVQTI